MKERILGGLIQYLGTVALVALTVAVILAFRAGTLPFMDSNYLDAREEEKEQSAAESIPKPGSNTNQAPATETAATYTSKLEKVESNDIPYNGLYDKNCYIGLRSLSGVKLSADTTLDVFMGYTVVKESGEVIAVFDSTLGNVSAYLNGYEFTYRRDNNGNPLFFGADGYVYLKDGSIIQTDYDKFNNDKGLNCEYPSYVAGYDSAYSVFEQDGRFGLKKSTGETVIEAKYQDVYSVNEGYCVAIDKDNRLYLFDSNGTLICKEFYGLEKEDAYSAGYFFVRNGLTRARTIDGEEILLRTDGSVFRLPSGFELVCYTDGAILLKGKNGYGYMNYKGRWISTPEYSLAHPFNEGLAVVCDKDGIYGMIDLSGSTVVPFLFDSISNSSDGVIYVYTKKYGYYVLNKMLLT